MRQRVLTYAAAVMIVFNILGLAIIARAAVRSNEIQVCALHDILTAQRRTNLSLGLPVKGIIPPDVTGLDCPQPVKDLTP